MNEPTTSGSIHTMAVLVIMAAAVAGGSVLLQSEAPVDAGRAVDVAALLPAGTLFHISVDGTAFERARHELAVAEIWREPEVQRFVKPLLSWLEQMKSRGDARLEESLGVGIDDLLGLRHGRMSFSVTELDPEKLRRIGRGPDNLPAMVMTFEYPQALDTVKKLLTVFEQMVFEEDVGSFSDDVVGGVKVKHFEGRLIPLDLWYTVADKLFMISNSRPTFEGLMQRLKAGDVAGSLAETAAYKAAASGLKRDGSFVFACADPNGVAGAVAPLLESMPELLPQLRIYGDMEFFAFTSSLEGPGVRDRFHVSVVPGSSLSRRMPSGDLELTAHALAPRESRAFFSTAMSLTDTFKETEAMLMGMGLPGAAWEEGMAAVEEALGVGLLEEVLPHMGPECAGYAAWPGSALIPDLAMMFQVTNQQKLEAVIASMAARGGTDSPFREIAYLGHKIGYLDVKSTELGSTFSDIPALKPSWTFAGGFLVVCPWPQVARRFVRNVVEKRPGLDAYADFANLRRRLVSGVPEDARLHGVSYLDLKRFTGFVMDNLAPFLQMLVPADIPVDVAELPGTEVVTRHLFGLMALSWKTGETYFSDMYSPTGIAAPLAAAVAGIGVAAIFRKQGSIKALERARADRAMLEISTLEQAVKMFQLVEGRLPSEEEWPQFLAGGSKNHPDPYLDAQVLKDGRVLDPWGHPYVYRRHEKPTFEIMSLGADGTPGGTGANRDLSSVR